MKRIVSVILALICLLGCVGVTATSCDTREKLYVYNWGENIADGKDGSVDLIKLFEDTYNIDVVYTNYASNEEMYAKLSGGTVKYDVVIPSDYMIARLIEEGLVQKVNTANIPNYSNIAEEYKNTYYDPNNEYSVPYTVGKVGVVYNTKHVAPEDAASESWELLWNSKYTNKILMPNNSRDAFGVAMYKLGIDVNTTSVTDWERACDELKAQKSVLKGYVMDEIFDEMEGGNSYIGTYYAGDCLSMMDENPDLDFFYPVEGTNQFIDAMCIPTSAQNVPAAELFINFMLDPKNAIENSLYIYYASPNTAVINNAEYKEKLGEDYYEILYGMPDAYYDEEGQLIEGKLTYYHNLSTELKRLLADLWSRVK